MSFLKVLLPVFSGSCVIMYSVGWYNDIMFPAWSPLIWALVVFLNDIEQYMKPKGSQ